MLFQFAPTIRGKQKTVPKIARNSDTQKRGKGYTTLSINCLSISIHGILNVYPTFFSFFIYVISISGGSYILYKINSNNKKNLLMPTIFFFFSISWNFNFELWVWVSVMNPNLNTLNIENKMVEFYIYIYIYIKAIKAKDVCITLIL